MIKYPVYNQQGEVVGEKQLSEKVFGLQPNLDLIQQAVVAQRANARQVLAHTKDRSEVRGSGKKPWKQKGTGRARVGSVRSPLWRGGGITFGPTSGRNFSKGLNDKMRRQALLMALSDKVAAERLVVVDKLELSPLKTKTFSQVLATLEKKIWSDDTKRSILLIRQGDDQLWRAGRNLTYTKIINLDNINLVDILHYKNLILTEGVLTALEARYGK